MIAAVQASPSKEVWHYTRDGERFGPTDLGGLRKMAACHHLLSESGVWSEGLPGWVPAATIETLVFPHHEDPPQQPATSLPSDDRYAGLYRSGDEVMILGVCAGIAHKWKVPVLAVRIAMVMLCFVMVGWAYWVGVVLPPLPTRKARPDAA
jgi:phage shock protein PspC (stress-responsive transcriptional regulator)